MWFVVALLPSVAFGTMSLLTMALRGDERQQTMGMILGGFIVSLVLLPFLGVTSNPLHWVIGFIAGVLLATGIHFQIQCFHVIGVSRTMPVSTASQLILMSLLGVLLLGEWRSPGALPLGIVAMVMLVVGVVLITWTQKRSDLLPAEAAGGDTVPALASTPVSASAVLPPSTEVGSSQGKLDWPRGILYLVISTLPLVGYLILLRWFEVDALKGFFPVLIGTVFGAFILTMPVFTPTLGRTDTRWNRNILWQLIPGVFWGSGLVIMQYMSQKVGVATGFTLSQLGMIISTVGGIVILKERRTRKELWVVAAGVAFLVAGAVLIGLAKGLDAS